MDRRTFNKLASLGAVGALAESAHLSAAQSASNVAAAGLSGKPGTTAQIPERKVEWPSQTFRRLLVDTHVPDWDDLLVDFNAADYVTSIAGAGFQSLMQYANSHVGLCLWRTKIGQMHRGMRGRDYFGEVMEQCRQRGLHRVAYYSLIFDDWAYQNHPEWRILPEGGYDPQLYSRTGTVCINSPYRDHALACLHELVGQYDFEGIFLDMTFWPAVCYCPHCTARFRREHNTEPPRIVDWGDPIWRSFQKSRQQWMLEFTKAVTQTIKQIRPISVYQQFSLIFTPWSFGVSLEQNDASDFCGGDFYGGAAQFSLVCKTYGGLTRNRPFEFMTSRTSNLGDFETTKPFEQILLESLIPTIHSAACLIIDAIKPNGTLNHRAYEYLSQVNAYHDPYEPFLGGNLLADVAIYYDRESMYDPEINGITTAAAAPVFAHAGPLRGLPAVPATGMTYPHLDAVVGTARMLREAHIPFGVITNVTLNQLSQFRAVILPSVIEMTDQQANVFREFARNGGILYASGPSSLNTPDQGDRRFLLEDVFAVRYLGRFGNSRPTSSDSTPLVRPSYFSPQDREIQRLIWPQENVTFPGPVVKGETLGTAEVLATLTPPFVDPDVGYSIGTHFAQIWSNPPAETPDRDPAIVVNSFGKGKSVWIAAPIESLTDEVDAKLFTHLLRRVLGGPYKFEVDTDRAVEMTLSDQPEKRRMLVGLLNLQERVPTIPVGATVRVYLPASRRAKRVLQLPEQKEIQFAKSGSYIQFQIAPFDIISMAFVEYV